MKDIHGQAILDYYQGDMAAQLTLHNSYGQPEEMSVVVFFCEEIDLTTLEHLALMECRGKVLDVGAGAGTHSLILQSRGMDVTALDNSPGCAEVLRKSGVRKVLETDFNNHSEKYDTVLVLMNGVGLAGILPNVPSFLLSLERLLNPNGQILIDSSDISYLYEEGIEKPDRYYGEVRYCYEYRGEKGQWFDWVYVDQETLKAEASKAGLQMEVLMTDENDQYLVCLSMVN